ncbi:hypothetical protein O181_099075 [Austropuccinia psidii MF-1]|uniref:Uncharacterized protein n=1 Tax=Austropuccinia psidii MF-1 TaxID=1389203 RepID=A0A9Q3JCX0_9BASI|nr:hypothetical protein [Austropuccinia psidii MF-1]
MSSKLTELTESSPSVLPQSVLCGSDILSLLDSPWLMASSANFYLGQMYDGSEAVEVLDPACTECLAKGNDFFQHFNPKSSECHLFFVGKKPCCCPGPEASNIRRQRDVARWTNVGGPIPVGGRPIYSCSKVPISRINTEGVVKWIRLIANSPPDWDAEGSDELDGEEVKVVNNPVGHQSSASPSQPPAKRFQSRLIPSTPREVRQCPIKKSRALPIVTSQQLQPYASSSRRREELSPLPFPAAQVFQQRDHWAIRITREDTNMASEIQDSVARLFRQVDRNSREVIMYVSYKTIPGTAAEEMASKFSWYEDELIQDFQRTFDHMGRDN